MNDDDCPICEPGTCKGYPRLWERLRDDPARWAAAHEQVNSGHVYPSVVTMAGNAARAAAGFVRSGLALADEAEQSRRMAICGACEFFASDANRCAKCGCGLSLKARIASSKCPINRW